MRKKIENRLKVTCDEVDLTTLTDIEFYVRQTRFFGCYKPSVISSSEMVVVIPFEDAKKLQRGEVKLQFAYTDEYGNSNASEIIVEEVSDLLKEVGYAPI
jgi:hypothetical protein